MTIWLALLSGLLIWTAHFFGLYLIGEFGGDTGRMRLSAAGLTLLCGAAVIALASWLRRHECWVRKIGLAGALISLVTIVWQAMPLILI